MRAALPSVLLFVAACPPPTGTTTDSDQPSTTSSSTSTTTGLTTTGSTTTGQPTTSSSPDLPPPCPIGSFGCPCTGGGGCDDGLSCDGETCIEGFSPPCDPDVNDDDCCGDGVLDELEECDMGNSNGEAEECTPECKQAVCGDGFVLTDVEACDGGDECTPACTLKSCGNGVVDPGEDCEPQGSEDPGCTDLCADGQKIIFVSSVHYKGGEIGSIQGGVLGADGRCQELAVNAGLTGTFRAWLATTKDDAPLHRFTWFEGPYVDVLGGPIAGTWKDIYDAPGVRPARFTELGAQVADSEIEWLPREPVLTRLVAWASHIAGPYFPDNPLTCGGWNDTSKTGTTALLDHNPNVAGNAEGSFSASGNALCSKAAPIICVEQ